MRVMMFLGVVRYCVRGFGRGVGVLKLRLAPVSGFGRVYRAPAGRRSRASRSRSVGRKTASNGRDQRTWGVVRARDQANAWVQADVGDDGLILRDGLIRREWMSARTTRQIRQLRRIRRMTGTTA